MSVMGLQVEALSDGAATGLIIALGAGGSFAVVLLATLLAIRRSKRSERKAARAREREMATVGGGNGQDAYPPQPYSARDPKSHRPYSRPYRIPRQDSGHTHGPTNGSRPAGSTGTGVPTTPWPPTNDED